MTTSIRCRSNATTWPAAAGESHRSPYTIRVDPSFDGLLAKIKRKLEQQDLDPKDPENEYRFESMAELPREMHKLQQVVKEEREQCKAPLSKLCLYIDDMLGDLRFKTHLDALFSRGRHIGCSVFRASQVFRGASSTIRKNIVNLICFRFNQTEYQSAREEVIRGGHCRGGLRRDLQARNRRST